MQRWLASNGKFNRCQLGHYAELQADDHLQAEIKRSVKRKAIIAQQRVEEHPIISKPELCEQCLAVLAKPGEDNLQEKLFHSLLQAAKRDTTICGLIRRCGFNALHKFTKFRVTEAAQLILLHCSTFLSDMDKGLRQGLAKCIQSGNSTQWKETLEDYARVYENFPLYQNLLDSKECFDAMTLLGEMKKDLEQALIEASKMKSCVQIGRKESSVLGKQAVQIKRKISELSSQGDSTAERALEKLNTDEAMSARGRKETKSNARAKEKRRLAARPRYKRKTGDGLTLIKKRAIAFQPD